MSWLTLAEILGLYRLAGWIAIALSWGLLICGVGTDGPCGADADAVSAYHSSGYGKE